MLKFQTPTFQVLMRLERPQLVFFASLPFTLLHHTTSDESLCYSIGNQLDCDLDLDDTLDYSNWASTNDTTDQKGLERLSMTRANALRSHTWLWLLYQVKKSTTRLCHWHFLFAFRSYCKGQIYTLNSPLSPIVNLQASDTYKVKLIRFCYDETVRMPLTKATTNQGVSCST
jgi:hypothetical protein